MLIENPKFLAKKYNLSDPDIAEQITDQLNQGWWVEHILSYKTHTLVIYLQKPSDSEIEEERIH